MNLIDGFLQSALTSPDRPALDVGSHTLSYADVLGGAKKGAYAIQHLARNTHFCVGILSHRSKNAYLSILATLLSGQTYMPLNPKFPASRLAKIIELSGCSCIMVGSECETALRDILALVEKPLKVITLDFDYQPNDGEKDSGAEYITLTTLDSETTSDLAPITTKPMDLAYLLFTSGSTGSPKGVAVSQANVHAYLQYLTRHFEFSKEDRFSQSFDLSFDLSVHDMFVCWSVGGCLCVLPESAVMAPAKFIKDKAISVWFSVPSVAMFMSKFRTLKPNSLPNLRLSLFCGEAFSQHLAQAWQEAAPNSLLYNFYGPTETTIAITQYLWNSRSSPPICLNGVVPIGHIFPSHECAIVDDSLSAVDVGQSGQLMLSGPQITPGYLNDPGRTRAAFVKLPGDSSDRIWYGTGDLAKIDSSGCLFYLGRKDDQIQILGYRAELQEIDLALRIASGSEMAVAVAWPIDGGQAQGVVGFVCGSQSDAADIISRCGKTLPQYMVPREVYFIEALPLNSNGKVDRKALQAKLQQSKLRE